MWSAGSSQRPEGLRGTQVSLMKHTTTRPWPEREGAERETKRSAEQSSWLRGCAGTCWSQQKWHTQVQLQRGRAHSLESRLEVMASTGSERPQGRAGTGGRSLLVGRGTEQNGNPEARPGRWEVRGLMRKSREKVLGEQSA